MKRALALDVGSRRIGIAISDPSRLVARSLSVLERRSHAEDMKAIEEIIAAYEVDEIVIGYPRHLSGQVGEQAKYVEEYAERLKRYLQERSLEVQITLWDEQFSSVTAEELLRQPSRRRRDRRRPLDAVAAAVILQDYLDAQRPSRPA